MRRHQSCASRANAAATHVATAGGPRAALCWVARPLGPVGLGRRPDPHRFHLFLFHFCLNNYRNSIKFLKYIENEAKLIKIQSKFLWIPF
jgi:hypothetical protein